jgi:hypothetical protein
MSNNPIFNILIFFNEGGLSLSVRSQDKLQEKKWYFKSSEEAGLFQLYIATLNNIGHILSDIFKKIDTRNTRLINWKDLRSCALKSGFDLPDEECLQLIDLVSIRNTHSVDYLEFFQYFMRSPITTVEGCINEWRAQLADTLSNAYRLTGDSLTSEMIYNSTHHNSGNTPYLQSEGGPMLLKGEMILSMTEKTRYCLHPATTKSSRRCFVGNLYFTPYRLIFSAYLRSMASNGTHYIPPSFDDISIPLTTIMRIETPRSSTPSISPNDLTSHVVLTCKDMRTIRIAFSTVDTLTFASTFAMALSSHVYPDTLSQLFAFKYAESFVTPNNGWSVYSAHREFTRQGVLQLPHLWRIWNDNYELSDTYPLEFILPVGLSPSDVIDAAKYRSRCRLPALTWRNQRNGAVLCRSSQPMAGMLGHTSLADRLLLNLYRVRGDLHDVDELEDPSGQFFYNINSLKKGGGTNLLFLSLSS